MEQKVLVAQIDREHGRVVVKHAQKQKKNMPRAGVEPASLFDFCLPTLPALPACCLHPASEETRVAGVPSRRRTVSLPLDHLGNLAIFRLMTTFDLRPPYTLQGREKYDAPSTVTPYTRSLCILVRTLIHVSLQLRRCICN